MSSHVQLPDIAGAMSRHVEQLKATAMLESSAANKGNNPSRRGKGNAPNPGGRGSGSGPMSGASSDPTSMFSSALERKHQESRSSTVAPLQGSFYGFEMGGGPSPAIRPSGAGAQNPSSFPKLRIQSQSDTAASHAKAEESGPRQQRRKRMESEEAVHSVEQGRWSALEHNTRAERLVGRREVLARQLRDVKEVEEVLAQRLTAAELGLGKSPKRRKESAIDSNGIGGARKVAVERGQQGPRKEPVALLPAPRPETSEDMSVALVPYHGGQPGAVSMKPVTLRTLREATVAVELDTSSPSASPEHRERRSPSPLSDVPPTHLLMQQGEYSPESTMSRTQVDPAKVPRMLPDGEGTLTTLGGDEFRNHRDIDGGKTVLLHLDASPEGGKRKGPVKCLYGKKLQRRLAHPLQEERPFFDVWPASNGTKASTIKALTLTTLSSQTMSSQEGTGAGGAFNGTATFTQHESVFVRPQLLSELEDKVRQQLQQLTAKYPKQSSLNPVNPPDDETLSPRNWVSALSHSAAVTTTVATRNTSPQKQSQEKLQPPPKAVPKGKTRVGRSNTSNAASPATSSGAGAMAANSSRSLVPYVGPTSDKKTNSSSGAILNTVEFQHSAVDADDRDVLREDMDDEGNSVAPVTNQDWDALISQNSTAGNLQMDQSESAEDQLRAARARVFSGALMEFADQFKSYRRLLLWMAKEFDDFLAYCHRNVMSEAQRRQLRDRARVLARQEMGQEVASLRRSHQALLNELTQVKEQHEALKQSSARATFVISDKDKQIKEKDAELAEAEVGRAAMLGHIERMEKELWQQRNLIEGPERRCQELQKQLSDAEDKIRQGLETIDELAKERALLRNRLEKLEEQPGRRMGGAAGMLLANRPPGAGLADALAAPAQAPVMMASASTFQLNQSDLLQYKKREMDLLHQIGHYKARCDALELKVRDYTKLVKGLQSEKGGGAYTPRPNWSEVEELMPKEISSAKRVMVAAVEMSALVEAKAAAVEELQAMKELIGALPRGLGDVTLGEQTPVPITDTSAPATVNDMKEEDRLDRIVADMMSPCFFKLGLAQCVPTYLKGQGHVPNIHLRRNAVLGICRLLWIERELNSKSTVPVEQFVSRFCSKFTPEGVDNDVFAYNFHHSLHWYAFDPVIGFTKDYVTGRIDELTFYSMQSEVRSLKDTILKHGNANSEFELDDYANSSRSPTSHSLSLGTLSHIASSTSATNNNAPGSTPQQAPLNPVISKTRVISVLMEHLPMKSEQDVKELILAMSRDCPGKDVDINLLFAFNEGSRSFSSFLDEWYTQYLRDRQSLLAALSAQLFKCHTDANHEAAPADVAKLFWEVDPDAPAWYMDSLLATLFAVTEGQLFPSVSTDSGKKHVGCEGERIYQCEDTITADLPMLLRRLRRAPIKKFTAPKLPTPAGKSLGESGTEGGKSPVPDPLLDEADEEEDAELAARRQKRKEEKERERKLRLDSDDDG